MQKFNETVYVQRLLIGEGGLEISAGSAAPTHTAKQGSLYIRTGQAINACLYINTDGGTTWTLANAIQA
uniref:Uncharacterized protein n=1 Tax=viral metagenome TaxID=1070528 RepID=A0A6M3JA27_9ZZZZ